MENETLKSETGNGPDAEREGFDFGAVKLSAFGPADVLTLDHLAALIGRHRESVLRAVRRGELPAPVRLCGCKCWTAASLTAHFEHRLALAAKDRERLAAKMARLAP